MKERWTNYRKATGRENKQLILPLIDNNENILFEEKEKSNELQRKLFEGKPLLEETFDKEFYDQTIQ